MSQGLQPSVRTNWTIVACAKVLGQRYLFPLTGLIVPYSVAAVHVFGESRRSRWSRTRLGTPTGEGSSAVSSHSSVGPCERNRTSDPRRMKPLLLPTELHRDVRVTGIEPVSLLSAYATTADRLRALPLNHTQEFYNRCWLDND